MAREKWVYPNLEKGLIDSVDRTVESKTIHGGKKYTSRNDFIVKAIQKLLDSEGIRN